MQFSGLWIRGFIWNIDGLSRDENMVVGCDGREEGVWSIQSGFTGGRGSLQTNYDPLPIS